MTNIDFTKDKIFDLLKFYTLTINKNFKAELDNYAELNELVNYIDRLIQDRVTQALSKYNIKEQ